MSSRKVKNTFFSGDFTATSVSALPGPHPGPGRAVRRAARALLLVAFLGSTAKPTLAKQTPTNAEALLEKAREEENTENYDAAENTYRQALAVAPENLEVLKRLGVLEQTEL